MYYAREKLGGQQNLGFFVKGQFFFSMLRGKQHAAYYFYTLSD